MAVDKNKNIFMDEWQTGIAKSAHVGFSKFVNIDILSNPGVAKLQYKVSSATVPASLTNSVINFAIDTVNMRVFAQTYDNRTYYTAIGDYLTWVEINIGGWGGAGAGLTIWEGCLFINSNLTINILRLSDFGVFATWKSFNFDRVYHTAFVSRDNVLYFGDGSQVAKLKKVGGTFDPATPATYSFTLGFLDTKNANITINTLEEVGTYLACGTYYGTNLITAPKLADVFFWNSNLSADQFTTKVSIKESGVNAMFTDGAVLYVQVGLVGNLYTVTPGYIFQSTKIKSPLYLNFNNNYGSYVFTFQNSMKKHQNELVWGISNTAGNISPIGLMSMNLDASQDNPYPFTVRNLIATGNDGSTGTMQITSVLPIDTETILIGRSGAIDVVRVTSYGGYIESPLYSVGTNLENVGYSKLEFSLANPLSVGQGVRIKYRKNLSDAFLTVVSEICPTGTMDFASLGAVKSYSCPATITDIEDIQLRVELTSTNGTTPELKQVRLLR
jgi:hypothetical protein